MVLQDTKVVDAQTIHLTFEQSEDGERSCSVVVISAIYAYDTEGTQAGYGRLESSFATDDNPMLAEAIRMLQGLLESDIGNFLKMAVSE